MHSFRIAVNLSAQQFRQSAFVDVVRATLADAGLEARYLEIELTETAVMQDTQISIQILQQLSRLGIRISIDDFGTGYSSLSQLRRLPLDNLKIDRAFISEVLSNRGDAEIVRAIISLAHSLRLEVTAEGVENADQLSLLRSLGCDQYQGYFCSPPVANGEFVAMLRKQPADRASA